MFTAFFAFLLRVFRWRSTAAAQERDIFCFCDHGPECRCKAGEAKCRRIDPMQVMIRLLSEGESVLEVDLKVIQSPLPIDAIAKELPPTFERIDKVVRSVFKLAAFDDRYGLTTVECVALLNNFMAFAAEIKKKAEALQKSLGYTVPAPFPKTLSPTGPSSASGSTAPASSPSGLPPSPPASASPLAEMPTQTSGTL
jgi:hypothetical protein